MKAVALSTSALLVGCATAETPAAQVPSSAMAQTSSELLPIEQAPQDVIDARAAIAAPVEVATTVPAQIEARVGNTKWPGANSAAIQAAVAVEPVPEKIACRVGNTKRVPQLTPEECEAAKAESAARRARANVN